MKRIWNTFCEDISKNKGVKEMTFEKEIVKGFLQALGWSAYSGDSRSPIPMISVHSVGDLLYRRQS